MSSAVVPTSIILDLAFTPASASVVSESSWTPARRGAPTPQRAAAVDALRCPVAQPEAERPERVPRPRAPGPDLDEAAAAAPAARR